MKQSHRIFGENFNAVFNVDTEDMTDFSVEELFDLKEEMFSASDWLVKRIIEANRELAKRTRIIESHERIKEVE